MGEELSDWTGFCIAIAGNANMKLEHTTASIIMHTVAIRMVFLFMNIPPSSIKA